MKSTKLTKKEIGRRGEQAAADYLKKQGYTVLFRNYRSRHGEIDLIAVKGRYLCFCEVKTRGPDSFGRPALAVSRIKRQRLIYTAKCFCRVHRTTLQPRFDVLEVYCAAPGVFENVRIYHLKSAFDLSR